MEVARHRSMVRAAAELNMTAPGISTRIKEIETELGLSLFDRDSRNVSLSGAGEYFLTYARRILAEVREAEFAVARFKRLERGLLTVGIGRTAEYFVPEMLARFHEKHPHIDIKIRTETSREALKLMEAAEVDLSIVEPLPNQFVVRSSTFATNPFLFVCSPRHPAALQASISVAALKEHGFVVREAGSGARAKMEGFFNGFGYMPKITMEIPTNQTIKHSVMAGLGVGFLPLHTIGLELSNGLLTALDVEGTPILDSWTVVHSSSRELSPAAGAFREFILAQGSAELRFNTNALLTLAFSKRQGFGTSTA